ncbi:MAG TPA: hypothetical protein VNK24_07825 [Elusimicrobiota bacterium]|nr:hypothetical protein [Elusimicrobiota bacterium]
MKLFHDYEGLAMRLTSERWGHIGEHPEMRGHLHDIGNVLSVPERVVQSGADPEARLYYRYFFGTEVGDK